MDNDDRQNELYKASSGRWCLNGLDLTCGDVIEVNIAGYWIKVIIEHEGDDYYAIPTSIRLHNGLFARFIGEWTE